MAAADAAELQSKPFSKQRSNPTECSMVSLLRKMEKCWSHFRWSNSHTTSKHIKRLLLQIGTSSYLWLNSLFFSKGSQKCKLHHIKQTQFHCCLQATKAKHTSSFAGLSNVLLRALRKHKFDINITLTLSENMTKLTNQLMKLCRETTN